MSEGIAVAIIGFVGVILVGYMEWSTRRTNRRVDHVRHEVTANGGSSAYDHLRGDVKALNGKLDTMAGDVRGLRSDVGDMHKVHRDLRRETRAAIEHHEQTYHRGEV